MSKKRKKRGNWLKKAGEFGQEVNKAISSLGLEKTGILLSEGFCPVCNQHGTAGLPGLDPDELEFDDHREATANLACPTCKLYWRAGINPMNNLDWIEYTQFMKHVKFSMTVNAPPEGDEYEYEDDWESDEPNML